MRKIHSIFMAILLALIFVPASVCLGQYIPNAPFKPQYPKAPDFTLTDSWGNSHTLSDYRGNVVVLMFFGHT